MSSIIFYLIFIQFPNFQEGDVLTASTMNQIVAEITALKKKVDSLEAKKQEMPIGTVIISVQNIEAFRSEFEGIWVEADGNNYPDSKLTTNCVPNMAKYFISNMEKVYIQHVDSGYYIGLNPEMGSLATNTAINVGNASSSNFRILPLDHEAFFISNKISNCGANNSIHFYIRIM